MFLWNPEGVVPSAQFLICGLTSIDVLLRWVGRWNPFLSGVLWKKLVVSMETSLVPSAQSVLCNLVGTDIVLCTHCVRSTMSVQ